VPGEIEWDDGGSVPFRRGPQRLAQAAEHPVRFGIEVELELPAVRVGLAEYQRFHGGARRWYTTRWR
jgi:hypothetical protein